MRKLLVDSLEYHRNPVKPRNFEDFVAMYDEKSLGPVGLWRLQTIDKYSGEVLLEQWRKNALTDTGGLAYLTSTFLTLPTSLFNIVALTTDAGSTTLAAPINSGTTYTSLSVAALPAAIPSGTQLTIGYGSGTTALVTTSASASAGATSISILSYIAGASFGTGTNVVPVANYLDNPTSLSGASYSPALGGGNITISGTGPGSRQMQLNWAATTAGGIAVGNYTAARIVNTNPVSGVGQVAVTCTFMPMAVNSSSNGNVFIVEKV